VLLIASSFKKKAVQSQGIPGTESQDDSPYRPPERRIYRDRLDSRQTVNRSGKRLAFRSGIRRVVRVWRRFRPLDRAVHRGAGDDAEQFRYLGLADRVSVLRDGRLALAGLKPLTLTDSAWIAGSWYTKGSFRKMYESLWGGRVGHGVIASSLCVPPRGRRNLMWLPLSGGTMESLGVAGRPSGALGRLAWPRAGGNLRAHAGTGTAHVNR
jgi:hypothetical protein